MYRSLIVFSAAAAMLAACSPQQGKAQATEAQPASHAPATPAARDEPVALGLPISQLQGANLLSTDKTDVGDVERVDVNSEGKPTGLIVAPTGPGERWVRLPLAGLVVTTDGDDHIVTTSLSLAQIKALPAWVP